MTRAGPIAAAFRVIGKQHSSNDGPAKIVTELLKSGKITVVDSKAQGSLMELKVPTNETPQRIYWEGKNLCYSYPFKKVSLKYTLTEKDRNELLKNAEMQIKKATPIETLGAGVVAASAIEITVKLIAEIGALIRDPSGWFIGLVTKSNVDKKVESMETEVTNFSKSMEKFSTELGKVAETSVKTSNDVKELLELLKKHPAVEKKNQDLAVKMGLEKNEEVAKKGEEEEKKKKEEDEAEEVAKKAEEEKKKKEEDDAEEHENMSDDEEF